MTHPILNDWKKQAAAQFNDQDIELAFMEQAYGFIQNKAGKLLTDPHRLGFEIVYKNDSATRMVGMFAFRAEKRLIYAPCFYINGEIKGTDLLYEHDRKLFRPLTEEWVDYLLRTRQTREGQGYQGGKELNRTADLHRLSVPPGGRGDNTKWASTYDGPPASEVWTDMLKEGQALRPVLRECMLDFAGKAGIQILDRTIYKSAAWARSLAELDPETYAPSELFAEPQTKEAGTGRKLELVRTLNERTKSASAQDHLFKLGFVLLDDRERDLTPVEVDDPELLLQSVGRTGVYDLITADGTPKKGLAMVANSHYLDEDEIIRPGCGDPAHKPVTVVWEGGEVTTVHEKPVYGECEDGEWKDSKWCSDKPAKGSTYILVDDGGTRCTEPIKVLETKTVDEVTTCRVTTGWGSEKDLVVNPDVSGIQDQGCVVGSDVKWVKVKTESRDYDPDGFAPVRGPDTGSERALDRMLKRAGVSRVEIRGPNDDLSMFVDGRLTYDQNSAEHLAIKLAKVARVHGEQAMELVAKPQSFYIPKSAAMKLLEDAQFEDDYDSRFGVTVRPDQSFALDVDQPMEEMAPQRIGDIQELEGAGMERLLTETPEALAQFAQMNQLPNLFEHGMVGALTRAFDAPEMINRYVQDMERALDAMGRSLFLLFWKPGEFDDAWGPEERQQVEDEMLSNFKGFGELVLTLLRKNANDTSTMPLGR
jgi:hypothetical protein